MHQLTSNVFVETQIRGCNHGFVTTADGIVLIDTPHKPSDAVKLKAEIAKRGKLRTSSTPSRTAITGPATRSSTCR